MPRITENQNVNATGGGYVDVTASMVCRGAIIEEDPNNGVNAGLKYRLPDDGFVAVHTLEKGATLELGNAIAKQNNQGPIVGMPAQSYNGNAVPATVLAKVESAGAATKYRKTEIE